MTNLEAATEAIRRIQGGEPVAGVAAFTALDAIDSRLADLTPEDTQAILDLVAFIIGMVPTIPDHVFEVLSR